MHAKRDDEYVTGVRVFIPWDEAHDLIVELAPMAGYKLANRLRQRIEKALAPVAKKEPA